MKDLYLKRIKKQFSIIEKYFTEIFRTWEKTWDSKEDHDKLYDKYIDLCILALLIRRSIDFKIIIDKNISVYDADNNKVSIGLKSICDYFIHQSGSNYSYEPNKLYLHIYTDKKMGIKIDIIYLISKISSIINKL